MKKSPFLIFLLVASMLLSQFASATAAPVQADRTPPTPVSLNEVVEYYGRLGDIEGPIGVVVEFSGKPATLVYAEAKESRINAQSLASITTTQVNTLQRQQDNFASALKSKGIQVRELFRAQRVYNGIWLYVDASQVAELAKMPDVKALHPIVPKELEHTTSVPLVGALQAWAGSGNYQGENISIGIIDTGIDYVHTNFGGGGDYTGQDFTTLGEASNLFPTAKVVGGWDFVGDAYNAAGSGAELIPVPDPDPMDCNGHGSHVAGTAAGFGVLPNGDTYTESVGDTYADLAALSANDYISKFRIGPGVAPKADLYALRVFGCQGSTNVTEQAIEWAMDPNDDGDFSDHLDVINMSLGSSFGSESDTSAVASNNAVAAGVIVVASAGNSSDIYYITGAPGVAHRAISVANSMDSGAVVSAFELVSTTGTMTPGTYYAVEAAFGPTTFNTTAELVLAVDGTAPVNDGCQAITNNISGKIALIDRGTCNFAVKYDNAVAAGAAGVLIANNLAGAPFGMGGTPTGATTIPAMMTTLDIGTALKADLVAGTVTVRLTTDYQNQFVFIDPTLEDTLTASSSRGIARVTNYLKPDIAAPGDTIFSTANGTGNKGVSLGGTSMASPHVAGAMALLREQNPNWTVAELKALVMNTATEEVTQGANTSTPSRVGAGRMVIPNALASNVIAYNADNPDMVSVPFGVVKVVETAAGVDQTLTKSITVSNKGLSSETYNVAFALRYQTNPGIAFSLVDGSDNPLSSVTVPAGGTETVVVKVQLNAATLAKTRDATISTASGRFFMAESGGLVIFTSTGSAPTLRVPVHISARAASEMEVQETSLQLPAAAGTVALTPTGTPVDLSNDFSVATVFELLGQSPNDVTSTGSVNSADLQYIGAMSNYGLVGSPLVFFGFSTYGDWDTFRAPEFDIYVDTNGDGNDDYVIYNSALTGTDAFVTVVLNLTTQVSTASNYVNAFTGATNTNAFNNNVVMMPVAASLLGLSASDTDFDFYVATFHRDAPGLVDLSDVYSYNIANRAFTTTNAALSNTPAWFDDAAYSPTFNIAYNKAYMDGNTQGLLVLHHHNAANTAEVVPLSGPTVLSITRASTNPTGAVSVDFTVTFSEDVTGVDAADFSLTTTGAISGASVTGVTGSGAVYTVTVSTGTGPGTLRLDLNASGTGIQNLNGNALAGGFTTGEAYTILGGNIPNPWIGGVAIQSNQSIVAVGRPHLGSQIASYIGSSAGSTTQYVPMLFKDAFGGSYKSALYIQNLGSASANLTIEFINEAGAVVHTVTEPLAAKASKGYWLSAIAGIPAGFAGGAKVTADQPVLAVGRPHIGAEVMSYNGMSSGSTTAWLPMFFKNGFGDYNTALYVQNITNSSANLTIEYLNLDGTVACTKADTVAANASKGYWSLAVTCDTGSLPMGFVGGVKVTSTQNILAVGRAHLGTQITTYNGFAGGAGTAYVPMLFRKAYGGTYNAALYLQNVSGSSADVTIEYVNDAGAVATTQNVTLAAGAIGSIWLPTVAGLPDGFVGGARITATQDVIAVGRPHLDSEITAYNGASGGSLNAYLPMLFKNAFGNYQSAFYIQNVTGNAATVNISFYDDAGTLACIKSISLAANATQGFWMPTVTCAP